MCEVQGGRPSSSPRKQHVQVLAAGLQERRGPRVRAGKCLLTTALPSTVPASAPQRGPHAHASPHPATRGLGLTGWGAAPSPPTAHAVAAGSRVRNPGALPRPCSPPAPPRDSRWSPLPAAWTVQPGPPGRRSHRSASHRLWGHRGVPRARLSPRLQPLPLGPGTRPTWRARAGRPASPAESPSPLRSRLPAAPLHWDKCWVLVPHPPGEGGC